MNRTKLNTQAQAVKNSGDRMVFKLLAVIGISVAIVCSRWLPHAANFSPILALLMIAGTIFRKDNKAIFLLPMAALFVSDIGLGLYDGILFNYLAYALAIGFGFFVNSKNASQVVGGALASSAMFFFFSNFGVWASTTLYPRTWAGLVECLGMGVPFFRNSVLSTIVGSVVIYGMYNLALRRALKRA